MSATVRACERISWASCVVFWPTTSSAGLLVLLLFMRGEGAWAAYDSSFLGEGANLASPVKAQETVKQPSNVTKADQLRRVPLQNTPQNIKTSSSTTPDAINGLTHLINSTQPGPQRNIFLLDRASLINQYVREKLIMGSSLKLDQNGIKYLETAVNDAKNVLASPDLSPDMKYKAHNIIGVSSIYLDRSTDARNEFIEAIRIKPKGENSGWMGMYIAEVFFDTDQYKEAVSYYREFFGVMSRPQQELATYKLAWCMMKLDQPAKAEELLLRVIKSASKQQGLAKDALRDLAYLLAHHKDSEDAIKLVEQISVNNEEKIEFLEVVRTNLEAQNDPDMHTKVVNRLFQLETDRQRRLDLMIVNMKVNHRPFASRMHHEAFLKLQNFMRSQKLDSVSPEVRKSEVNLDAEMQMLLKAFIDSFSGKTETPEKIPHSELGAALESQLEFYHQYFPNSKKKPIIMNLWLDLCTELKDWKCLDHLAELSATEKRHEFMAEFTEKAQLGQIVAMEEIARNFDKVGYAGIPSLTSKQDVSRKRLNKLSDFIKGYPRSKQWLRLAKRYAELLLELKNYDEVIPVLGQIYDQEKSADAFYRIQSARYTAGKYKDVAEDQRTITYSKQEPRLLDLQRESSLALALDAKNKGNIAEYKKDLRKFLDLKPDAKKAAIARKDYFNVLLQQNQDAELTSELLNLTPAMRQSADMVSILFSAWAMNMEKGRFQEAHQLLSGPISRPELKYKFSDRDVLTTMVMGGTVPSPAVLSTVSPEQRDYFLGVIVLAKPELVLKNFDAVGIRSEKDRDLALLALRLSTGQWLITKSDRAVKYLGKNYKFVFSGEAPLLPIEIKIQKIIFPATGSDPQKFSDVAQNAISITQKIRETLPKEIASKTPDLKYRVLEKARILENNVAAMIRNSPVPKELNPEQVNEYKQKLQDVAKGFEAQGLEYGKLAVTLNDSIESSKQASQVKSLPVPPMDKWRWPEVYSKDVFLVVKNAEKAKDYLGALLLLDFLKVQYLKQESDYFRIRSGLLLSSPHLDPLRRYLYEELEQKGQKQLLEEWQKLVIPATPVSPVTSVTFMRTGPGESGKRGTTI